MTHIEQFWKTFLKESAQAKNVTFAEAFSFGHGEAMADSLAQLVLQEKKTATCYRYVETDVISQPGELSIVLDGRREPVCIIETVETILIPYGQVEWELAKLEGENETLESWQKNHREFFENEGKRKGFLFNESMLLCFEKFKVIYKGKRQ